MVEIRSQRWIWILGALVFGVLAVCILASVTQSSRTANPVRVVISPDGDWDYTSNPPHLFTIPGGRVGIGTSTPSARLEVSGRIYSNAGGFKFPDGTVQKTAATSTSYAQVWTVAQAGGDFTTIGAALAACVSPSASNRYLVRVMPGSYVEVVVAKSWVTLQGAGKDSTEIVGSLSAADDCTIMGFEITDGVTCAGTSPTLIDNRIRSSADGVWVTSAGTPWIQRNEIRDCAGWGIHCDGWNADAWIIANQIESNLLGGIRCTNSAPTISNNQLLSNEAFGIYLVGALGQPSEPTIDDNVIGRTSPEAGGIGIFMTEYAEPRVIANDIWVNDAGIWIDAHTQPSVLGNEINYNRSYGIRCFSNGASKPVVIKGNHIHGNPVTGIDIVSCSPVVTHNNVHNNDPGGVNPDIQYAGPPFPNISLNVFDRISLQGSGAVGAYNVTTAGVPITP